MARAAAQRLRVNHHLVFEKLEFLAKNKCAEKKAGKFSKEPGIPGELMSCRFCNAVKHTVAWKYRENGTKVTGGTCYRCAHATVLLGCTRDFALIKDAGALELIREVSQHVSERPCTCNEEHCKRARGSV